MSKVIRYGLIGVVASAAAIFFISTQLNLDNFDDTWADVRFVYLVPTVLLLVLGLVARAVRWRILLSDGLPLYRAFSILNVAYLINGFIPFRVGELARAYLASRAEPPVPIMKSVSTIIVERLLDLLAVVLMIAIALATASVPDWLRVAGFTSGAMAFGGFLVLVFLSRQRDLTHRILDWVLERFSFLGRFQLKDWLDHFLDGLLPLAQTRTLILALLWNGISWGLSVVAGYVLMFAFYDDASWVVTCLYIAAAAFSIAVPAVPGNVGTYEAAILLALGAMDYGEPENVALAFALTVHAVNVGVHALTGVIGFIQEGVTLDQLSQGVRQVTEANQAGTV